MSQHLVMMVVALAMSGPAVAESVPAQAGVTQATQDPVVVSSGEGVVRRAPDRAWITATVESRARNPREAQKLNADVMSTVLQKLRGAGLRGDAIQTRGYDLQPEYDYVSGRQTLRAYVARNTIQIRVDDLARVGELLDVAVTAGASAAGGVRFDLKDRAGAEREALRLAVEDARNRADAAASGAGMKVERIVRIEEHPRGFVPPPQPMMAAMRDRAAESAAPPIEPGELEVRATVTLTAAIR